MLLLSTQNFSGYGLHKIFDIVKKSNYDGIELVLNKNQYDVWDADYVLALTKEFKVPVLSLKAPKRGISKRLIDKILDLALKLKVQNVTFMPPYFRDKNISRYLEYLPKIKKDHLLSISIENVEPKFFLFVIPEHKEASLRQIKKITGDVALNIGAIDSSTGLDIIKAHKILGASIKNVYISDTNGEKKGLLPGCDGGGISYLPIESFLMKLNATSYNGFVTLEVSPKELGVGNEEKILYNLKSFKLYYNRYMEEESKK